VSNKKLTFFLKSFDFLTVEFVIAVNESMMYASDQLIIIVSDDPYIAAIRV
jgi:hypothetical protein